MYAILNISGKQYKAMSGTRLKVPKQDGEVGTRLKFDKVLLINDGKNTEVGEPILKGASITGTIIEHGRDKKILVYKKKRRKGYQRKNGHRQWYTEIQFDTIKAEIGKPVMEKTVLTEAILEEEE